MKDSIVIKIGGSLVYDSELSLNKPFLFKVLKWYEKAKKDYKHIVIVVGGGNMSRHLTGQLQEVVPDDGMLHRIGMATTLVNSEIIRAFLHDDEIFVPKGLGEALEMMVGEDKGVTISGGFKEGWSTDMDAAVFADLLGVGEFYKLSNVDYIYTADPKTTPNAQPMKDLSWDKYMNHFGITIGMPEHKPGMHTPVGAFASQFCAQKGISVRFSGGTTLEGDHTLEEVMKSGSIVHP